MVKWTAHAKAQVRHIHDYIAQELSHNNLDNYAECSII